MTTSRGTAATTAALPFTAAAPQFAERQSFCEASVDLAVVGQAHCGGCCCHYGQAAQGAAQAGHFCRLAASNDQFEGRGLLYCLSMSPALFRTRQINFRAASVCKTLAASNAKQRKNSFRRAHRSPAHRRSRIDATSSAGQNRQSCDSPVL